MLLPGNKEILQWVSEQKAPSDSRVVLSKVTRVHIGLPDDTSRLKGSKYKFKGKEHLCMALVMEKDKNLEVIFDDEIQMMLFVTGVQIFIN